MLLIKLNSDNFEDVILTARAYEIVCLEMSTGDYLTHVSETMIVPDECSIAIKAVLRSEQILEHAS